MLEDITALLLKHGKDHIKQLNLSGAEITPSSFDCENIAFVLRTNPESVTILRDNETNTSGFNPVLSIATHPEIYDETIIIYALFSVFNNLSNGAEIYLENYYNEYKQTYDEILNLLTRSSQNISHNNFEEFLEYVRGLSLNMQLNNSSTEEDEENVSEDGDYAASDCTNSESSEQLVSGSYTKTSLAMNFNTLKQNANILGLNIIHSLPSKHESLNYTIIFIENNSDT